MKVSKIDIKNAFEDFMVDKTNINQAYTNNNIAERFKDYYAEIYGEDITFDHKTAANYIDDLENRGYSIKKVDKGKQRKIYCENEERIDQVLAKDISRREFIQVCYEMVKHDNFSLEEIKDITDVLLSHVDLDIKKELYKKMGFTEKIKYGSVDLAEGIKKMFGKENIYRYKYDSSIEEKKKILADAYTEDAQIQFEYKKFINGKYVTQKRQVTNKRTNEKLEYFYEYCPYDVYFFAGRWYTVGCNVWDAEYDYTEKTECKLKDMTYRLDLMENIQLKVKEKTGTRIEYYKRLRKKDYVNKNIYMYAKKMMIFYKGVREKVTLVLTQTQFNNFKYAFPEQKHYKSKMENPNKFVVIFHARVNEAFIRLLEITGFETLMIRNKIYTKSNDFRKLLLEQDHLD